MSSLTAATAPRPASMSSMARRRVLRRRAPDRTHPRRGPPISSRPTPAATALKSTLRPACALPRLRGQGSAVGPRSTASPRATPPTSAACWNRVVTRGLRAVQISPMPPMGDIFSPQTLRHRGLPPHVEIILPSTPRRRASLSPLSVLNLSSSPTSHEQQINIAIVGLGFGAEFIPIIRPIRTPTSSRSASATRRNGPSGRLRHSQATPIT